MKIREPEGDSCVATGTVTGKPICGTAMTDALFSFLFEFLPYLWALAGLAILADWLEGWME